MGLDMYLNKKIYVGNNYRDKDKQIKIVIPKNQKGVLFPTNKIMQERVTYIEERIGYWRKANAIHQWFVDNVQGGDDNCRDYYVDEDNLKRLLNIVNQVLEDNSLAPKLLPTQEGFFFGSQEYDDYYFQDLKDTKKIIENALKEKGGEIYYKICNF